MNKVAYNFDQNTHSLEGAKQGLAYLLMGHSITSLLDVGAGPGNWLRAARDMGIDDVMGVDGVAGDASTLSIEPRYIKIIDLRRPLSLCRRFDAALCLEVAEHLPEGSASVLVRSICAHADLVFFSAAAPGQQGQNHINCQWPKYWQGLFNDCGYVCDDSVRWNLWEVKEVEPWYRQNVFCATYSPDFAGTEVRIRSVIHPEMPVKLDLANIQSKAIKELERGSRPVSWYLTLLSRAILSKIKRRLVNHHTRWKRFANPDG